MKIIKQKFVVDESGSMIDQQQTVISGFNEQLSSMKQEEKDQGIRYLVTLVKFSDKATTLFKEKPLEEVPILTTETYNPHGWTALYDAIGAAIDTAAPGETDTIVTIFTDGHENRSREWKKTAIKTLIELRQRENKWGFVYFGAEQDAWAEASSIGVANAVNYTAANTGNMMRAMGAVRSTYSNSAMSGVYNTSNLTCNVNEADLNK